MNKFDMLAKTFQGLEGVLAEELRGLGAEDVVPGNRVVSFRGDQRMMYRANFCLRTAVRVLKPLATFKAQTADEVYDEVKKLDWAQWLDLETTFAVDSVVYSNDFRNSKFVSYKVKDAIVDYFREKTGKRPNISVASPDIRFNMHIAEDACTLSLDSSGESLHKRGWRVEQTESPINEVLAAGLVLLTGWQGECDFIDPMCGSGTIAIEAALIARNMAPGLFRKHFAFERWKDFDADLLQEIYNDDSQEREFTHHIYGYDIDPKAIAVSDANVKAAGMSDVISLAVQPIQKFTQPKEKSIIVTNPPYGERISAPNLPALYRTIGERLKHQFVGCEAWIIGYREESFAQIGLKPSLMIPLYNGSLNCEFRKYTMFEGGLGQYRAQGGVVKTDDERLRNAGKKRLRSHDERHQHTQRNSDFESEIPDYVLRRHQEFVANQNRKEHGEPHRYREQDNSPAERSYNEGKRNHSDNNFHKKNHDNDHRSNHGNGKSRRF